MWAMQRMWSGARLLSHSHSGFYCFFMERHRVFILLLWIWVTLPQTQACRVCVFLYSKVKSVIWCVFVGWMYVGVAEKMFGWERWQFAVFEGTENWRHFSYGCTIQYIEIYQVSISCLLDNVAIMLWHTLRYTYHIRVFKMVQFPWPIIQFEAWNFIFHHYLFIAYIFITVYMSHHASYLLLQSNGKL